PDRQRPRGPGGDRRRRQRLRLRPAGDVRQGRPGRARGRRGAHAAGPDRSDHRRAGGMSDELLAIADTVVGWARDDEQVEVVVGRSTETESRVYEGDIESLSSAGTAGVGVRVIHDHRQGFAYAGSLDPDVLGEVLAEARDNATFATPDEFLGLAEPD